MPKLILLEANAFKGVEDVGVFRFAFSDRDADEVDEGKFLFDQSAEFFAESH